MGIHFQSFKVKDIAFLAVMAALLILCACVAMPFMAVPVFGLRNMATAPFYGIFGVIALLKVRKPGALTLMVTFNVSILFSYFLYGKEMSQIVNGKTIYVILACIGTVVLSFVGTAIGMKIGKELKKAGKLR